MDGISSPSGIGFMMDYSFSVTNKAMDTTEAIAENLVDMIETANPTSPPGPAKGQFIDVYA